MTSTIGIATISSGTGRNRISMCISTMRSSMDIRTFRTSITGIDGVQECCGVS